MNLRTKTLLSLAGTLVVLLVVVALASTTLLLQGFRSVEQRAIANNTERVREALQADLEDLELLVRDWGPWDDVYEFAASRDPVFIEQNLNDLSLANIRLNIFSLVDSRGELLYGTGFDAVAKHKTPIPPDLVGVLAPGSPLLSKPDVAGTTNGVVSGFAVLRSGIYFVASHPILTSDFQGPSRGTLVFGRLLDATAVDVISRRSRLPATPVLHSYADFVEAIRDRPLAQELQRLAEPQGMLVDRAARDFARSYFLLRDVRGQPALVVEVATRRDAWGVGRRTVFSVLAWTLVAGLVFGGVMLLLLEHSVLRRLSAIIEGVTAVRTTGDLSRRLHVRGADQLADLGGAINELLDATRRAEAEHARAEHALAGEKERLIVTLRSIGDGVIAVDADGKVVLLNRVAELMSGWTTEDAAGRSLSEVFRLLHESTRQPLESPLRRVLSGGQTITLSDSAVLVAKDGRERAVADSAAPIRDGAGGIIGAVLVFRDVTEQRKAEQERLRANKLESIGLLAGGIAHDFNNILTAVLANISLAQLHTSGNNELREVLAEAETASLRARDLTRQLLTFAKGGTPVRQLLHLAKLVRETAEFASRGSAVRCEFHIAPHLATVEVDPGQISQVVDNLVINAIEAMPDGGVVTVSVSNEEIEPGRGTPPSGRYVVMAVQDRGVGIPAEDLERIFEPYFTTKMHGSGLGLATCYSIVKHHGGYLLVESTPGEGSTFRMYLPAVGDEAPPDEEEKSPSHRGRGRVLVMDDEASIRTVTQRMLVKLGYDVTVAHDGAEAVSLVRQALADGQPYAVLIMDLTVPGGVGGKEAMSRIRAIDPSLPAIVSSGYSNDPVMSNYRDYGFHSVIRKPYGIAQLGAVLSEVVRT